jgi:hypothetical protein
LPTSIEANKGSYAQDCSVNVSKLKSIVACLSKSEISPEPATLPPIKSVTNTFTKRKRDTKEESKGLEKIELSKMKYMESKRKTKQLKVPSDNSFALEEKDDSLRMSSERHVEV